MKLFVASPKRIRGFQLLGRIRDLPFPELVADGCFFHLPLGKQLKIADRWGADYTIILRGKEKRTDTVILRNMKTGEQETILQAQLSGWILLKIDPTADQCKCAGCNLQNEE